jgi:predicted transcriptional regulator
MDQILNELTQLAALTGESEEAIKAEALRHYLSWRLPQQRALQAAIVAADRDEFASADEVRARFARYGA